MFYEILDFRHKNEQPGVAYETECDSIAECIDEFITMLVDNFGDEEEFETIITMLQNGEYEVSNNSIKVYTYRKGA